MVGYGLQCHSSTPGVFPDQSILLHLAKMAEMWVNPVSIDEYCK